MHIGRRSDVEVENILPVAHSVEVGYLFLSLKNNSKAVWICFMSPALLASSIARLSPGILQRNNRNSCQDANNGNDDQKFNEGKSFFRFHRINVAKLYFMAAPGLTLKLLYC